MGSNIVKLIVDDASLYYECYGTGPALLLLHGNGEDHTYFQYQLPYFLKQGYQVIVMDMRGHGNSSFGERTLNFSLFVKDIKALMSFLSIAHFDLLGFSDGANTAMLYAIAYPEDIDHMILNAGNLHPLGMKISVFWDILKEYVTQRGKKRQILALMVKQPWIRCRYLRHLRMKTLVITGENDMIRANHTKKIAKAIPNCKQIIIKQGDHFVAYKKAKEFNEAILTFLQGGM